MAQFFEPISTSLGIIRGRDAIFLDEVIFEYKKNQITLKGEINSSLCSDYSRREEYIGYTLTFSGLIAVSMIELDLSRSASGSSFDRVVDSEWIKALRKSDHSAKVKPSLEHYVVATYDDVFNFAGEAFELKILEARK